MTGLFTNTTLSASALNDAINSLTLNAQSGAGYTLVLADAGKLVTLSNASSQNLTIPLNSSVAYATGTVIEVLNIGAGTWTLTPTGGVTLTGSTAIPTSARVRLTKTATDTWYADRVGGGGLTFITSATASAAATLSVNSCFTTAFDSYRILWTGLASVGGTMNIRWRVSAADNTTTNYSRQRLAAQGTTVAATTATAQNFAQIADTSTTRDQFSLDVYNPALAVVTTGLCHWGYDMPGTTPEVGINTVGFNATTQFDGFTIYPASGTITGTIRVYGYSNS